jgi:hypothetical protein
LSSGINWRSRCSPHTTEEEYDAYLETRNTNPQKAEQAYAYDWDIRRNLLFFSKKITPRKFYGRGS